MIETITTDIYRIFIEPISRAIYNVFIVHDRWAQWLSGLEMTLSVTFFALLLGLGIGLFISIIRVSHDAFEKPNIMLRLLNLIVKTYVSVVRGIPMVVQLAIWAFIVFAGSRNQLLTGIVAFGINSGAYVSEVFRGGISSIDKGQMEAGRSLGLSYPQTMFKIILPQAVKNCLPALGNEFIALLKETSIAGFVAISELTHVGNVIRGITFNPAPMVFVALIYLILVLFLEFLVRKMENKLSQSDRRSGKMVQRLKRKRLVKND
ncbi:MAG: amino acid ABC transporter permease [Oscillospiraceae bacterium]|nr:amino acid ABC transporter permease [Oscillospiraceae bacterium]